METLTYSDEVDNCQVCGRLTHYIDATFGCHVCSEECADLLFQTFLFHLFNEESE